MKSLFLGISFLMLVLLGNAQLSYDSLLTEYHSGKLHDDMLLRELASMSKERDKAFAKQLADKIINGLPEDSLYVKRNLHFMYDFTRFTTDRGFLIFRDHAGQGRKNSDANNKNPLSITYYIYYL